MSAGVVAAHYVDAAPGGGGTGYAAAVLADSPLAYWRLDEASGAFADQSGNGKTLTTVGTVTRITPGAVTSSAGAVTVNDTSGYLDSNLALSSASALTIEMWIRAPSDVSGALADCRPASGNSSLTLSVGGDPFSQTPAARIGFGLSMNGTYLGRKGAKIVIDGTWRHIVGTWQGGGAVSGAQFQVYVDGALDDGGTVGGGTPPNAPISSNGQGYRFGTPAPGGWPNGGFSGDLDEIAIYPTALSAARIAAHYAARTA